MIGIKRSIIMAVTGAALVVSGSLGAIGAPASSSATSVAPAATADTNVTQVKHHWKGGGHHHRHRGHSSLWWGAPLLAAPFIYNGYNDWGDYSYSGYGYRYGGRNSCYRACRYEHGPRYCRYNWEDYC
jgi:hypothetical protein